MVNRGKSFQVHFNHDRPFQTNKIDMYLCKGVKARIDWNGVYGVYWVNRCKEFIISLPYHTK